MGLLSGKTVIITGASRGIGAAAAAAIAEAGAGLMLLARSRDALEAVAKGVRRDAPIELMACDIADYAQVAAAVERTRASFGRVDVLVNNAGVIEPIGPLSKSNPAEWAHAADINFKGVYNGMRAILPVMQAQGGGTIITLGSGAAHNPLEGWSQYCSAKAAAFMLTRCVHLEAKGRGIRAISLSPGTVATDMQKKIRASGINPVSQMNFSAHAPAEAPARALVWLATDDAAEFAGQEVSLRDPAIRVRIGLDPLPG